MDALALKIFQQRFQLLAFRNKITGPQQFLPFKFFVLLQVREQVLDVENTLNVVERLAVHRNARKAGGPHLFHQLLEVQFDIHRRNIHSGFHYLLHRQQAKIHNPFQDIFLFLRRAIVVRGEFESLVEFFHRGVVPFSLHPAFHQAGKVHQRPGNGAADFR